MHCESRNYTTQLTSTAAIRMMDSPPRKKQKGKQLTLFGGVLVGSAIHKGQNVYEKFVNSFVAHYSDQTVARADVVARVDVVASTQARLLA